LNSRYRGKRGPTNVLAFLADAPAAPAAESGGGQRDESPREDRVAELPPANDNAGNTRPRGERGTLHLRERDGNTLGAAESAPPSAATDGDVQQAAPSDAVTDLNRAWADYRNDDGLERRPRSKKQTFIAPATSN